MYVKYLVIFLCFCYEFGIIQLSTSLPHFTFVANLFLLDAPDFPDFMYVGIVCVGRIYPNEFCQLSLILDDVMVNACNPNMPHISPFFCLSPAEVM